MINSPNALLLFTLVVLLVKLGAGENGCPERCGHIHIRFPFQLTNNKLEPPGYPGFYLSCTDKHETMLELATAKFFVKDIDYQSQEIQLYDPENCLPRQMHKLTSISNFPFQFKSQSSYNVTFFECSTMLPCPIRPVESSSAAVEPELASCRKMSGVLSIGQHPIILLYESYISLKWLKPNCSTCQTESFACKTKETQTSIIAAGVTVGSVLLVAIIIAMFYIHRHIKRKGEDQARIEQFLEDYKALKPTRFSYFDIKRITNGFNDKLGEGAHGAVFKGKLSDKILVAVKVLNNTEGDGKEFINEVGTMGKIHHVNVVRLLGFCADGFHRALVYNFFPNGSLEKFISPPDKKEVFLGWEKLQRIALGVAKGIDYLHQGCEHRILHFDINPHSVLIDDTFTPKITDFGLAKLCPKNQSTVSMTTVRGTLGYIAPEVFSRNFGNVTYKSDIYSYGMLLLEMVGGRKNTNISAKEAFQVLYPEWIHNLVEGRDMHIHVEGEDDNKIAKKLAIVGLWCIQWNPADRPSMKMVLQMLEGNGDKLTVPPTPFDSHASAISSATNPPTHVSLELEVIHEIE